MRRVRSKINQVWKISCPENIPFISSIFGTLAKLFRMITKLTCIAQQVLQSLLAQTPPSSLEGLVLNEHLGAVPIGRSAPRPFQICCLGIGQKLQLHQRIAGLA